MIKGRIYLAVVMLATAAFPVRAAAAKNNGGLYFSGNAVIGADTSAATVSEPATSFLMLGAGLLLAGRVFRNRNRRTR